MALCDVIYNAHHLEAIAMWDSFQNGSTSPVESEGVCIGLGISAQFGSVGIYSWNFVILCYILYEMYLSDRFDHQESRKYWFIGSHCFVWCVTVIATAIPGFMNDYQRLGSMGCWISYRGHDVSNLIIVLFTRTLPILVVIVLGLVALVIILFTSKRLQSRIYYVHMPGSSTAITSFPTKKYASVIGLSFVLIWSPVLVNLVLHHFRAVDDHSTFGQVLMCVNIAALVMHGTVNAAAWWYSGIIHEALSAKPVTTEDETASAAFSDATDSDDTNFTSYTFRFANLGR